MFENNIFLIGFMGTGKSTVATCFARQYGMEIIEMDEMISNRAGMSIPEIFERYGEEHFRNLETEFLRGIRSETNRIVSCGGGVVLRKENVTLMKESGVIVLLTASPEVILERVKNDNGRPLLQGKKNVVAISELMEARRERYEAAADIVISTDQKTTEEICEVLKTEIERMKER